MDRVDKAARSKIMSRIRSTNNRSTEKRLRAFLIRSRIRGWKVRSSGVPGTPDFTFQKERVAVFADGCFWHACPECGIRVKSNRAYWRPKMERNKARDARVDAELLRQGWTVIRVWEHEIAESPREVIAKIRAALCARRLRRARKRTRARS
ncbi:very short patch repair endonuclease [Planctomycetota bacterium]